MSIIAHVHISPKGASLNGKLLLHANPSEGSYLRDLYDQLGMDYPKFHKMDVLAKLAILGDTLLAPFYPDAAECEQNLQLIMANKHASYDTDTKFIESYTTHRNPSPSLFVYTLPNILTGELMIRNKWYGENVFFIEQAFNPELYQQQSEIAFLKGNSYCLCGWVDAKTAEDGECFLFLLDQKKPAVSAAEIRLVYNSYTHE